MTVSEILASVPPFNSLSPDELGSVAALCRRRTYQAGDTVFFAGDPGHLVYFVGSGKVKIHVMRDDGEETVYSIVSGGEFFGEMSLIDGQPRSADATCIEPTELASMPGEEFLGCMERFPGLSRRVMEVQSARLRSTDRQLEVLASLDVYGRVAAQLLELARQHGAPADGGTEIRLGITQQNLADMIGASRESVNKALNRFKSRGFIAMDRGRITLLDEEELRKRAA